MPESTRTPIARRAGAVLAAALALLLGAWLAPGTFAGPAAEEAPAEPRFPIERIRVEGARHASAELIVAESLLGEGRSYGEDELRQAVYRIRRLPFVIDTRFALRRGSERGSYELVITVEEASPVFFGLDVDNDRSYLDGFIWEGEIVGTVGARWFAGDRGVLYGAIDGDEAQVGYTHYDLFGRGVFASFAYGRTWNDRDGLRLEWDAGRVQNRPREVRDHGDVERFSLLAGFPLTVHQSVRLSASSNEVELDVGPTFEPGDLPFLGEDDTVLERARAADLQWIYDSTDDPVLPTRGWLANLGIVARNEISRTLIVSFDDPPVPFGFELFETRQELENASLVAGVRKYRPLSSRQVRWDSAQVALGRAGLEQRPVAGGTVRDQSATGFLLEYGGGWAVRLWEPGRHRDLGDLRFETTWRLRYSDDGLHGFGDDWLSPGAGVGFVLRNRWGLFRFGFNIEEISGSG